MRTRIYPDKKIFRAPVLGMIAGIAGVLFCSFQQQNTEVKTPELLKKGFQVFRTDAFNLKLVSSSQTVAALSSTADEAFDFAPGEWLEQRSQDRFYHLGDVTISWRNDYKGNWEHCSTADHRKDVMPVAGTNPRILSSCDLSPTLPDNLPFRILRNWEKQGEKLILRFDITNKSEQSVEIGALGFPMIFNNKFDHKSLEQAHRENVFYDPYIGKDAGYLQVVRLDGTGNVLLVAPLENTSFEAYRPLLEDPDRIGYTFEGFYEWTVHSKAYSEVEWKGVEQWNQPTSIRLEPGESRTYSFQFFLAPSVRKAEETLAKAGRPVAVGIPGYVLPADVNGSLFLHSPSPVSRMSVSPEGALKIKAISNNKGWKKYNITGKQWGRARLTVEYEDGRIQTIHYKVIAPESSVVTSYGRFLTTKQWFNDPKDPFGRAPSVITYDYEEQKQVTQDMRVWIPGLSDEGGAGSWLGAIMKQLVSPRPEEVEKMEDFVNKTLWGKLQYSEGPLKYGVRKSMFYYEPDSMPAGTYDRSIKFAPNGNFPSWNRSKTDIVDRSYNYPHVAAAHWVLYRLARYKKGLVTQHDWNWYLENAFQTSLAMINLAPYYARFGQMEGSVFILILKDLRTEGLNTMADQLEAAMKVRAMAWKQMQYPFESEMLWDSTGQEEVYMWSRFFGFDDKAEVTLNAILAYMPTVPHWGYNGNARRFWDFQFGGKMKRFERMIHHYGSGLNAIPVLDAYRRNPDDLYLLRVGYGGLLGAISNITKDGFAPCAFHSYPNTLRNDGITGDYGCGFYGYAVNTSAYLVQDKEFGWLGFGGNIACKKAWISITPTTADKSRLFIAPQGLWITLDAGQISKASYNASTEEIRLEVNKGSGQDDRLIMSLSVPGQEAKPSYEIKHTAPDQNGRYSIPLKYGGTVVILSKRF